MIFNLNDIEHIYIASEFVDFRRSINGLVGIVNDSLYLNPQSHSLFLFTNKKRTSIKIIYYETNGYWLFQKTLLNKDKFMWPKNDIRTSFTISNEQLEWLLRGMELEPKHQFKRVRSASI